MVSESRAIVGVQDTLDVGFRMLLEASIKPRRSGDGLLLQMLPGRGLELSVTIGVDQIEGHNVFVVEDGALIA